MEGDFGTNEPTESATEDANESWIVYTDENGEQVRVTVDQYKAEGR